MPDLLDARPLENAYLSWMLPNWMKVENAQNKWSPLMSESVASVNEKTINLVLLMFIVSKLLFIKRITFYNSNPITFLIPTQLTSCNKRIVSLAKNNSLLYWFSEYRSSANAKYYSEPKNSYVNSKIAITLSLTFSSNQSKWLIKDISKWYVFKKK